MLFIHECTIWALGSLCVTQETSDHMKFFTTESMIYLTVNIGKSFQNRKQFIIICSDIKKSF